VSLVKASEVGAVAAPPRYPAKRAAIARAALLLFVRDGYERTSVDAIAREAGVSKRTVYSHYADKEQLFLSVTEQTFQALMEVIDGFADRELYVPGDVTERLAAFIRATAHATSRLPERAALIRVIMTEAPRFPQLLDQWRGRRAISALLERALAELGPDSPLDIDDPREAAGHLSSLTLGQINSRTLNGLFQLSDAELDAIVDGGMDVFVRAYRRA
jgi:TetR/AcrR family transcriptional repressor of mexJK operon